MLHRWDEKESQQTRVVISFNPSTVMVSLHEPKGRWQLALHSGGREFCGHQAADPEHVVIPSDTGTLFPPYGVTVLTHWPRLRI
jgi:hypothetical protein